MIIDLNEIPDPALIDLPQTNKTGHLQDLTTRT